MRRLSWPTWAPLTLRVMVSDRDEVSRALAGGVLAGREVREVKVLDGPEVGFEVDIAGEEVLSAWQAARALVDRLGRWPLSVDVQGEDVYSRFFYYGEDTSPQAVLERARSMTLAQALAHRHDSSVDDYVASDWDRIVSYSLEETARRIGSAPPIEAIQQAVPRPDFPALESFLLDWEEARRPTVEPEPDAGLEWYDLSGEGCVLVLLPTALTEEVPAYVSFYGCSGLSGGHETLVCALRSWRERFGAELVASLATGTILELVVSRPPQDIHAAFGLTRELAAFGLPYGSLRSMARALLRRPTWLLHNGP